MNKRDYKSIADIICSHPAKRATRARIAKHFTMQLAMRFPAQFNAVAFENYCGALLRLEEEMEKAQ